MIVRIVLKPILVLSVANKHAQNVSKRTAMKQRNAKNVINLGNNVVSVDLNVKNVKNNASHVSKKIKENMGAIIIFTNREKYQLFKLMLLNSIK
uniref:Uncharacterized protein n=1 Tax=Meloidogyne incognita TaxID=6306 RepID=A0A914KVU0_MELIC